MKKQGVLDGFYDYCAERKMSVFFIFLFCFAVYGLWAFQNYVTFDAEGLYTLKDSERWYTQWVALGRWNLVLLKRLLGTTVINPYFSIGVFLLCFPLSVLFWGYDFYIWSGGTSARFDLAVFAAIYIAHPFWALQFAYRNQIECITIIMAVLPLGVLLVTRFVESGQLLPGIIGTVLVILCFGSYQSFIFVYAESAALYLFIRVQTEKNRRRGRFWGNVLILIVVTVIAFAGYEALSRYFMKQYHLSGVTNYMSSQFFWGKRTDEENINVIFGYLEKAFFGDGKVINGICGVEIAVSLVWFIVSCFAKKKGRVVSFLLLIFIWLIPFTLEFVTAGDIVNRSQFSFVLALAAGGMLEFHWIESFMAKIPSKTLYHGVLLALVIAAAEPLMQTNNRLLYTDLKVMDEDVAALRAIYYEAMAAGAKEGDALVLTGTKGSLENDSMLDSEVIGYSYLVVSGNDLRKTIEVMRELGLNVKMPTKAQIQMGEEEAASLNVWPEAGAITVKDDVIIVRLG